MYIVIAFGHIYSVEHFWTTAWSISSQLFDKWSIILKVKYYKIFIDILPNALCKSTKSVVLIVFFNCTPHFVRLQTIWNSFFCIDVSNISFILDFMYVFFIQIFLKISTSKTSIICLAFYQLGFFFEETHIFFIFVFLLSFSQYLFV